MQGSHSLMNLLAIVCCLPVVIGSFKVCHLSSGSCQRLKKACSEGRKGRVAIMVSDISSPCNSVSGTACELSNGPYCKSSGGNGHEKTGEPEIPRRCQPSNAECQKYKVLCFMGIRGRVDVAYGIPSSCEDYSGTYCELSNGPQCKWNAGNMGITRGCPPSNAQCQKYKMLCSMGIGGGEGMGFSKPSPCKDFSGTYCELSNAPQCKWSTGNTGVTRGCQASNAECQEYKRLCSKGIRGRVAMRFSKPSPCNDYSGTYCELSNGPQCNWSTGSDGKMTRSLEE